MHFTTLLLAATAALSSAAALPAANEIAADNIAAPLSKRACFATGASYGDQRGAARAAVDTFCGQADGSYQPGQAYTTCTNIGAGKQVRLTLTLRSDVRARSISTAECIDGLAKEVNNCNRGGETTYGNWRYRADPNEGTC